MDKCVTNRIAITNLDFDEISLPTLFKIFESEVENKILKISLFSSSNQEMYAICDFKNKNDAYRAYTTFDGIQIEKTKHSLNLSFIPDNFIINQKPISECTNSENFKPVIENSKTKEYDENMIEIEDDIQLDIEIPEEFKTKEKVVLEDKKKNSRIINELEEDNNNQNLLETLKKNEKKDDCADFKINLNDERFKDLFEDEDFILDASNKKFKMQKSSKDIIEKKFKN